MSAPAIAGKRIGYWGDMDTWGLTMLAKARSLRPELTALLMERELFDQCRGAAVSEGAPADGQALEGLTSAERDFYCYLRGLERGRVEQEFVPRERVVAALEEWRGRYPGAGGESSVKIRE
jgi:hypothetical protein